MKSHVSIRTLPEALNMIKELNLTSSDEWAGDYRNAAKEAIARILKDRMDERIAGHLSVAYAKGIPDRRNGVYVRHILTELGDIVLSIPRTRLFSPRDVIVSYARRAKTIDHLILSCFLLGIRER